MPTLDDLRRLAAQNVRFLDRLEDDTVREIARAYEQARRDLVTLITDARNELYEGVPRSEQGNKLRELARDAELLGQIDARLTALGTLVHGIAEGAYGSARSEAEELGRDELDFLLAGLEMRPFAFNFMQVDYASVEIGIEESLATLDQSNGQLAGLFRTEFRGGLIQGEGFADLVRRLLGRDEGLLARGATSAALGARRTIITANNAARDVQYRAWGVVIPGLGKQAVAVVNAKTTDTCLNVHGQVRRLDEPYVLEGEPKFASTMMYPSFHWNCRTSSVAYHPDFEEGARVTTADLEAAAQAELEERSTGDS